VGIIVREHHFQCNLIDTSYEIMSFDLPDLPNFINFMCEKHLSLDTDVLESSCVRDSRGQENWRHLDQLELYEGLSQSWTFSLSPYLQVIHKLKFVYIHSCI
jgi:hypothetical protein